ncbi:hypothetical protein LPJ78_000867 [Coemansia sp. RSA 989]|nr:hypothetical protein BX667DRAFT_493798 [Coemansia mojavensis]KAJ1743512.1 hypothetical protein LPJ68_000890 [Coemansia sp. RSA 1086]KAJ1753799.1 hypothetical protein LPJ79_000086 [Coemansia sp. RSA 1821]KAJ1867632.1 hypothetical protein LPJ78_000867 [Coemansia sp. RSA 989]KAJ1875895.1 hypothetical protein LPJ55_000309 [Coemansia sp. RSA 990]KAJ2653776.1 hypothetical protein IWW40_000060 [Coemansia sp. RSA 1250]KAJ2676928.1 hypothetical protein IWW42_000266 [Coemansia sp. RSA 1085]
MGVNTAPFFAPKIYSVSSSPIVLPGQQHSPPLMEPAELQTFAPGGAQSMSPQAQPRVKQRGKLPLLNTSAAYSSYGYKDMPLTPGADSGMFTLSGLPTPASNACDMGLGSPKFPVSPGTTETSKLPEFTPYLMDIGQPLAPELQHVPRRRSTGRRGKSTQSPAIEAPRPTGHLTPESASSSLESIARPDTTSTRIKRSLTTLLQRSSSVLRKRESPEPAARPRRISKSAEPFIRSCSPTPAPDSRASPPHYNLAYRDLAASLTASRFNVSTSNSLITSLVGNSMVHVKVIMDNGLAVVVPLIRSIVFARARERILTKFFQGRVPLVETKRCRLAVRCLDGSMAPIDSNPAWRMLMDVAGDASRQQAKAVVRGTPALRTAADKTVVKLTLYLTDRL